MMIGYSTSVLVWNLIWIIRNVLEKRNIFDIYNVKKYGWLSIFAWAYFLSGISILIIFVCKALI